METKITAAVAKKVLATVDAGLCAGLGIPDPGYMCVEAAVCYALGLPHGDNPECVAPALRALKIALNDKTWSSNTARARGLRRLALIQLGSAGNLNEKLFAKKVAELVIRTCVPIAFRAAASLQKDKDKADRLCSAANRCEKEGTMEAVQKAIAVAYASAAVAYASAAAASAADAAYTAASAAADAAAYTASAAADAASAYAAYTAASAAAAAASAAADAASYAVDSPNRDKILGDFAEGVVQILIGMKVPGRKWLKYTEEVV